jgi:hypothetical protein
MKQFQVTLDTSGNILCSGGYVIDLAASTTGATLVGGTPIPGTFAVNGVRQATSPNSVFMGGAGTNIVVSGTILDTQMLGLYQRGLITSWKNPWYITNLFGNWLIVNDGTEVAIRMDDSPFGDYESYDASAETTYNGGNPFILTATAEGTLQESVATVPTGVGTLQGGDYTLSDFQKWTSDVDSDFYIDTLTDGAARISDATSSIAERLPSDPQTAAGTYLSTAYGQATYNNDIPFTLEITATQAYPREGYVYVELTFSGGAFSSASELFFAATLPANTTNVKVIPIAYSDGAGSVFQIQEGPIFIR